ncbi:cytidylate kinase family protein [bacterium]|nr:cytidylate kinase family protein [bacterium]
MAIISIFSGPYCKGEQVADIVAETLGYERINGEVIHAAADRFNVSHEKLLNSLHTSPSLLQRMTHDREKLIAYLRIVLAERIAADNVVYHGFGTHLIPREIDHALRICLIANFEHRVEIAMSELGISEKKAIDTVKKADEKHAQWTEYISFHPPFDAKHYDMLIPMHSLSPEEAASQICFNSANEAVQTTEDSRQAVEDFILAANVHLKLAEKGHLVEVSNDRGNLKIAINKYSARLDQVKKQLEEIARTVEGVKSVSSKPGTGFVPPSLLPQPDLGGPSRVLLVDDEVEFVQTLSDRLQTRNMPSNVVFDGEQALEYLKNDEPEVMVLDLKMPGIDGIEVLKTVKKEHPEVEVIILTGHGSDKEREIAMALGAFAYLEKPVNIDVLAKTMREAYQKINKTDNRTENE